jgi:uncharacterized membrane protein
MTNLARLSKPKPPVNQTRNQRSKTIDTIDSKPMKISLHKLRVIAAIMIALVAIVTMTRGLAAGVYSFVACGLAIECMRRPILPRYALRAYTGVTLADIFIPQVYADIQPNNSPETSAFSQSGVVVKNDLLQAAAQSGTKTIEVPLWNDLDSSVEPNYSDDTDTLATPGKVDTTSYKGRNAYLNKAYSTADLAVELGKSTPGEGDPMTRIKNRFGTYWMRQFQYRIIAALRGILADNVANDSGDMLLNIALETTVGQTSANMMSANAIIDAVFTMGDKFDQLAAIAMHSVPYARLVKGELIEFLQDSKGALSIPTYLGKRVIIDDGLPVVAGTTSGVKYISILFGAGAVGYGEGSPKVPAEIFRRPNAGSGGGLEDLWERKTWLVHPAGFDWLETTVTSPGESATLANLRLAANWNRIIPRKNVPIAFIQTNG